MKVDVMRLVFLGGKWKLNQIRYKEPYYAKWLGEYCQRDVS